MFYCIAKNWGYGFITHQDKEKGSISGYPGNVWVCANNHLPWMAKINAVEKTKSEAQTIINTEIAARQAAWDAQSEEERAKAHRSRPTGINLP
jgi:hypothetical protein